MKQLLSAMVMMNQEKIMHRDMKPDNIILQTKGNISDLKIIDFGTALNYKDKIANGETLKLYDKVGTLLFMAPEVVNANMDKRQWYDETCDMWSIGIICYILLTGQMPFKIYHE
jgi:serine/threonine protein kinase